MFLFGTGFDKRDAFNYFVADEMARVAEKNSTANAMTHDPRLYQSEYTRVSAILDSTDPDLRAFADNGGKMLLWYGLSDTCVSVYRTAEYFDSVKNVMGESSVRKFARFLASPGIAHTFDGMTFAGPGAGNVEWLAAIDTWVEKGQAPDALVATRVSSDGKPQFQRPVCEYPKFPRYKETGDPTKADSFTCSSN